MNKKHLAIISCLLICNSQITYTSQEQYDDEEETQWDFSGVAQQLSAEQAIHDIKHGKLEEIEYYINGPDANVNYQRHLDGASLLMIAIINNQLEIAKYLLTENADQNIANNQGQTPLMIACLNSNQEMQRLFIQLLLEFQADVNAQDKEGKTVYMYAKESGNQQIIDMIIQAAAEQAAFDSIDRSTEE
jgi:ankyrin repeat protein